MAKDKSPPTFGDNLARLRKDANMSQNALAVKVGMTPGYISMLERGTRDAPMKTVKKLADALGIPPADLMEGI